MDIDIRDEEEEKAETIEFIDTPNGNNDKSNADIDIGDSPPRYYTSSQARNRKKVTQELSNDSTLVKSESTTQNNNNKTNSHVTRSKRRNRNTRNKFYSEMKKCYTFQRLTSLEKKHLKCVFNPFIVCYCVLLFYIIFLVLLLIVLLLFF